MITVQFATKAKNLPSAKQLTSWAEFTLKKTRQNNKTLLIRIVNKKEIHALNKTYRHKDKPTNVLAFPYETESKTNFLGDIIICAPIIKAEAIAQNKSLSAHWAHMILHGSLHLLGYDHLKKADARRMEALEIQILKKLGYNNPYE